MKRTFIIIAFIISIAYSGFVFETRNSRFVTDAVPVMPDVMGYVNVIESDGITSNNVTYNVDSFPLFSGFPKTLPGRTFEGGIFCNMDSDNDLEIVYNMGYTVQAWNYDGSDVPGWPQTVAAYALEGAPAFGDIDGDGQGEIVVTNHGLTSGGSIYAFRKNGTPVPGFPINHGYSTRTPVLANLDNAGGLEIIVNKRLSGSGEVWVYYGTGVVYPGWPQTINHVPASSSAVGDITGDGFVEIVSESYSSLYAWDRNGNVISGFPFTMPNGDVNSYSSPVLADVDGDNIREIVFGTHSLSGGGYVYLLKNNASIMSGWPKPVGQWIYGPPSVGYIDSDNIIDIAVGDQVLSGSPSDYISAWNMNGVVLTGFPIGPLWAINSQILIGDIDNDNNMELICDDNTTYSGRGKYLAFNHNGSPLANWDVSTDGSTFFSTPMLGDVNRDGILDIAGTGGITTPPPVGTNYPYLWNAAITYNPLRITIAMWQYNSRHNGVYGDNPLVGIEPISGNLPKSFSLEQNYPNPFNPVTKIRYSIPFSADGNSVNVRLSVHDLAGKEISILVNGMQNSGEYEIVFEGGGLSSGVYLYSLRAGEYKDTRKMILIK
jgi:hypothetical protein